MATRQSTILSAENLGVDCSVIDLVRPVTSGGGPVFDNWLSRLEVGDRFLFRHRQSKGPEDIGLQHAEVAFKYRSSTQLADTLNKTMRYVVDNAGFSALMKCEEILPKPEGTVHVLPSNDECDRTD